MKIFNLFASDFLNRLSFEFPPGFPNIIITSIHRPDSKGSHSKPNSAIDFTFAFKNQENRDVKILSMAKYIDRFWSGGFGYNQSQFCRHIHLDSLNKRRWIEKTDRKLYDQTNSCSKSLIVLPWKSPGEINDNDKRFYRKEFSMENHIQFPDGTRKTYDQLRKEAGFLEEIKESFQNPENQIFGGLSGLAFLPLILLFFSNKKRGKK